MSLSSRCRRRCGGPVPDQAALHGIINRLQGLGLEVVEVRRVDQGGGQPWTGPDA